MDEECSLCCEEDSSVYGYRLGLCTSKTCSTMAMVSETYAFGLFGHLSNFTLAWLTLPKGPI